MGKRGLLVAAGLAAANTGALCSVIWDAPFQIGASGSHVYSVSWENSQWLWAGDNGVDGTTYTVSDGTQVVYSPAADGTVVGYKGGNVAYTSNLEGFVNGHGLGDATPVAINRSGWAAGFNWTSAVRVGPDGTVTPLESGPDTLGGSGMAIAEDKDLVAGHVYPTTGPYAQATLWVGEERFVFGPSDRTSFAYAIGNKYIGGEIDGVGMIWQRDPANIYLPIWGFIEWVPGAVTAIDSGDNYYAVVNPWGEAFLGYFADGSYDFFPSLEKVTGITSIGTHGNEVALAINTENGAYGLTGHLSSVPEPVGTGHCMGSAALLLLALRARTVRRAP